VRILAGGTAGQTLRGGPASTKRHALSAQPRTSSNEHATVAPPITSYRPPPSTAQVNPNLHAPSTALRKEHLSVTRKSLQEVPLFWCFSCVAHFTAQPLYAYTCLSCAQRLLTPVLLCRLTRPCKPLAARPLPQPQAPFQTVLGSGLISTDAPVHTRHAWSCPHQEPRTQITKPR
jgi:hypothetical protein